MATNSPASPRIRIALTVDDLFQWKGTPEAKGYSCRTIAARLTDAFAAHKAPGVYAFSNTAPTDDNRTLFQVFDDWAACGHHVGNHTHHHASLNWLSPEGYIADIEKTEDLIAKWSDAAPKRYFRHCFDMWGDTEEKRDAVIDWLSRAGYAVAPISLWFYDVHFSIPYVRALSVGDQASVKWLRDAFVRTAVNQLRTQSAAARLMFGRDPIHIWLVHGTAIASDCLLEVLDAFAELGVEFVSLDEAMQDPMNQQQPLVTPAFRNQVQKWAELKGVPIDDCPPAILAELENVCPIPGLEAGQITAAILANTARAVGAGNVDLSKFLD
jgi:peptidoglycan/xylan/chitin deacetylase (PgdA/CDA1 family)